jgi:hypothetical protein
MKRTAVHLTGRQRACCLACAATMWLFGCATPAEVRTRQASLELTSHRPAKEVAACIIDRLEKMGSLGSTVPVNMRPNANGYTLSWQNRTWGPWWDTLLLADVVDVSDGSSTRYFRNTGKESFDKAVQECQ